MPNQGPNSGLSEALLRRRLEGLEGPSGPIDGATFRPPLQLPTGDPHTPPTTEREALDRFGRVLRGAYRTSEPNGQLPSVPHPSMFQADPVVVGSPEMATLAKLLYDQDPRTKAGIKRIIAGPNEDVEALLEDGSFGSKNYGNASLYGTFNHRTRDMTVNPELSAVSSYEPTLFETLAHELTHAAGYGEDDARRATNPFRYTRDIELPQQKQR